MITFPVNLKDVNEVIDFVNLANKVEYDVDLRYGSCIYDAKSVISAMLISAARSGRHAGACRPCGRTDDQGKI